MGTEDNTRPNTRWKSHPVAKTAITLPSGITTRRRFLTSVALGSATAGSGSAAATRTTSATRTITPDPLSSHGYGQGGYGAGGYGGSEQTEGPPALPGKDKPPQDLDNDGLYEDVNGDGEFDIFDIQTLFDGLESDPVQNNTDAFNFSGDNSGKVDIFDVQALFERL